MSASLAAGLAATLNSRRLLRKRREKRSALRADVLRFDQEIDRVFSYVDTVAVRFTRHPDRHEQFWMSKLCRGRRNRYYRTRLRGAPGFVARAVLHRPTRECLAFIVRRFRPLLITRVDISADLTTEGRAVASELEEFLRRRVTLKRHSPDHHLVIYQTTMYFGPASGRTVLVIYADKPSKIDGTPCVHLEIRTKRASAVRALGVRCLKQVASLASSSYWTKRIRVTQFALSPDELVRLIGPAEPLPPRPLRRGGNYVVRDAASTIAQVVIDLAHRRGGSLAEVSVHAELRPWLDRLEAIV